MTPEQALQILDGLAAKTVLDREAHQLVHQATATLAQILQELAAPAEEAAEEEEDDGVPEVV